MILQPEKSEVPPQFTTIVHTFETKISIKNESWNVYYIWIVPSYTNIAS